jgi:uncharacterized membrane protein YeaQ/YmgE (transglycosylase-associated protein family)
MLEIPQMTLLTWIAVGAIAGFLASLISGSREGLIMMVVLGIVGAIVGEWIAIDLLKIPGVSGVNTQSIIVAVAGALVVVFVVGSLGSGRRRSFGWR